MKTTAEKKYFFAGSIAQLKTFAESKKSRKVILGGELVLASVDSISVPSDYMSLPPRRAELGFKFLSKNKRNVQVWIAGEAFRILEKNRQLKPVLALDHYLAHLAKRKEPEIVLIGGHAIADKTVVTALIAKKGEIVSVREKTLYEADSSRYATEALTLVEKLRTEFSNATLVWASPLPAPDGLDAEAVDDAVFDLKTTVRLEITGRVGMVARHGAPLLLALTAAGGYVMALAYPYQQYQEAFAQFNQESGAFQGDFKYAADILKQMNDRKTFLDENTRQEGRLEQFEALIAFLGAEGVTVRDAQVRFTKADPRPNERSLADFDITVEVKKTDEPAIEQSKPLLTKLSQKTGFSLRLGQTNDGDSGSKGTIRQLHIEGNFPNAS